MPAYVPFGMRDISPTQSPSLAFRLQKLIQRINVSEQIAISCCDQLLNVLVILSHSGGLLLINLFARRPWQLGHIGRDPLLFKYFRHVRRRTPQFLKLGQRMPSICNSGHLCTNWSS